MKHPSRLFLLVALLGWCVLFSAAISAVIRRGGNWEWFEVAVMSMVCAWGINKLITI